MVIAFKIKLKPHIEQIPTINLWSPSGSFMVQKMPVTSPVPVFQELKLQWKSDHLPGSVITSNFSIVIIGLYNSF